MGTKDIKYFENLTEYVKSKTIDEILALTDSMYEFELFDGVTDAKSYGKYMICETGHFEYDSNLEDYIDFEKYGKQKMLNEVGVYDNLERQQVAIKNTNTLARAIFLSG